MSLETVTCALADFVESAALVAVTCTVCGEGKSVGAVKTPDRVIVPVAAVPPATPFTLQTTSVSAALLTVAEKSCVLPKSTVAADGVTAIVTESGGGGGRVTVPAFPPPHPKAHTHATPTKMLSHLFST
jgi:hypothetical protein